MTRAALRAIVARQSYGVKSCPHRTQQRIGEWLDPRYDLPYRRHPLALRPMTLQPELHFITHRSHYLFSDYYLTHCVAERQEWTEPDAR